MVEPETERMRSLHDRYQRPSSLIAQKEEGEAAWHGEDLLSALTFFPPSSFFTSSLSSRFRFRLFSSMTSFHSFTTSFARLLTPGVECVLSLPTATPAFDD